MKQIIFILCCLSILCLTFSCSEGIGVCVSDVVEYYSFQRVYCYNNFSKSECDEYDEEQVNGANWYFHSGQTCADRDLIEGSNNWP